MNKFKRRGSDLALLCLLLSFCLPPTAWGYAEEPIGFRDPATGVTHNPSEGNPEISTIHDDLTFVLALAAGFPERGSRILQVWNQLVDSETLPAGYSNCGGSFDSPPNPAESCTICKLPGNCEKLIWPMWSNMQDPDTCITSRFGPFSPFFHFPHRTGPLADRDLGALRDWAWGYVPQLIAYEAYAWGRNTDLTVLTAQCRYIRTMTVNTTMQSGSLEAFAVYLHVLADAYSHEDCIAEMDAAGYAWATHTLTDDFPACRYNPFNPQPDDVHGVEFGPGTQAEQTIAAALAVYEELTRRSRSREGLYVPLPLDTPLTVDGTATTLEGAIRAFVQNWEFAAPGPENRRHYGDSLATAILSRVRTHWARIHLPLVLR